MATLLLILFGVLAHRFPSWYQIESQKTLTVIAYPMGAWFEGLALISWFACIVSSIASLFTRSKWGCLSFLAALICPFIDFSKGVTEAAEAYSDEFKLEDVDGSEYHLFINSFFQGNKLLIAKVNDRAGSQTTYTKLVTGSFSGDTDHVQLIRPQLRPITLPLTITKDRVIIGTYGEKYAFAAYDLKLQLDLPISQVSPFAFLGPQDIPNQSDFEEALKGGPFSVNDPDVLKSELKSANPRVREMATKLIAKSSLKSSSGP